MHLTPSLFQNDLEYLYNINDKSSIFQAEFFYLKIDVKHILYFQGAKILICCDYLSSLSTLVNIRNF